MSRETYDDHLRRPGRTVDAGRVTEFAIHRSRCPLCSSAEYAYLRCTVGAHLAREATRPA